MNGEKKVVLERIPVRKKVTITFVISFTMNVSVILDGEVVSLVP